MNLLTKIVLLWALCLWAYQLCGQSSNTISKTLYGILQSNEIDDLDRTTLFTHHEHKISKGRQKQFVSEFTILEIQSETHKSLLEAPPKVIAINIPFQNKEYDLLLYEVDLFAEGYSVNGIVESQTANRSIHYRGIVKGLPNSLVSFSLTNDEVMGFISGVDNGNLVFGLWTDIGVNQTVVFNDQDVVELQHFSCQAEEINRQVKSFSSGHHSRSANNCVQIFLEGDYALYQNKGNGTEDWLAGMFNQVATIYALENIELKVSGMYIWQTEDPYSKSSSETALTQFKEERTVFPGDLAALLALGGEGTGGRAWINSLCSSFGYSYSNIFSNYSGFPNYSWTVNVVAHEIGHNLGSNHTHQCYWNGNNTQIDDCGNVYYAQRNISPPEPNLGCFDENNPVLPGQGQGTIMSYCHLLSSSVGIDFTLGFGEQPGNLMRNQINSRSCLDCQVEDPCELTITNIEIEDAKCAQANGKIEVFVSGVSGEVTYDIGLGGQASPVFENLSAGTYFLSVINGICTVIEEFTIQSSNVDLTIDVETVDETCDLDNGIIQIDVQSGNSPFEYFLNGQEVSASVNNLSEGEYSIVVVDEDLCEEQMTVSIFNQDGPEVSLSVDHTSCGSQNGRIEIDADGGKQPYTYYLNGEESEDPEFNNLEPGRYDLQVLDQNGCNSINSITIADSEVPIIELSSIGTKCGESNGQIVVMPLQGDFPFTYRIEGSFQSDPEFTGLPAGEYLVEARDDDNCLVEKMILVEESQSFDISLSIQETVCGLNNGSVEILPSEEGEYQYLLNGEFPSDQPRFELLAAGSFDVTVRDENNCQVTREFDIASSENILISPTIGHTTCGEDNGFIHLDIMHGSGQVLKAFNGLTIAESEIDSLAPGIYTIQASDELGCVDSTILEIDSSGPITGEIVVEHTTCGQRNGSIEIIIENAATPVQYQINNGDFVEYASFEELTSGRISVLVVDENFCKYIDTVEILPSDSIVIESLTIQNTTCGEENGSVRIQTDPDNQIHHFTLNDVRIENGFAADLPPGEQLLIVQNEEGCIWEKEIYIDESSSPEIIATPVHTSCGLENGRIEISISNGKSPFVLMANGVEVYDSMDQLPPGEYSIMVSDSFGCQDQKMVFLNSSENPEIEINSVTSASCLKNNATADLGAVKGVQPYRFEIAGMENATGSFVELAAGEYVGLVVDQIGCIDSIAVLIPYDSIFLPPHIGDDITICESESKSVEVNVDVNTLWLLEGDTLAQNTPSVKISTPGNLEVIAIYNDDCQLSDEIAVFQRPLPIVSLDDSMRLCAGDSMLLVDTLQYDWSHGQSTSKPTFYDSGIHTVMVTNRFGCKDTLSTYLDIAPFLDMDIQNLESQVCSGTELELVATGAQEFSWLDRTDQLLLSTGNELLLFADTAYAIELVGSNRCFSDTINFDIQVFPRIENGFRDTALVAQSLATLHFDSALIQTWSSQDYRMLCGNCDSAIFRPVEPGSLSLIYQDFNGCEQFDEVHIDIIPIESVIPKPIHLITPNGDMIQDQLVFSGLEYFDTKKISIVDMTGRVIYQNDNYENNWSGQVPAGIYFYTLDLEAGSFRYRINEPISILW